MRLPYKMISFKFLGEQTTSSNSPAPEQDHNETLTDDTSVKWAINKTFFLFFIRF